MSDSTNLKHGIPFGWHAQSQRMVRPDQVARGQACECTCVTCEALLIARQGAIREWHFAHGSDTNCDHAAEAAIHRMAKQLIVDRGEIFVPAREMTRTIYGKNRVWEESLTVSLQSSGLHPIAEPVSEKSIGLPGVVGESFRPDVIGELDGFPIAIEIRNTHAVDDNKFAWLKKHRYSLLEIDVADIADLPPAELQLALEARLFEDAEHSFWLTHAKDLDSEAILDQMESEVRQAKSIEEQAALAILEAEEAEWKRRQEFLKQVRDVEDFKIRFGSATVRLGRNQQRISLKVHGFAQSEVFNATKSVARRHLGRFNVKARCWEFFCHNGIEPFFHQLCGEVEAECFERLNGGADSTISERRPDPAAPHQPVQLLTIQPLPVYFEDPNLQEQFDERAGIREFEAGIERSLAEHQAKQDVQMRWGVPDPLRPHDDCKPFGKSMIGNLPFEIRGGGRNLG